MTNFSDDESSETEHNQLLENFQKKILVFQRTLDKFNAFRFELNYEESEEDSDVSHETFEDECEDEYRDEHEDENGELDYEGYSDEDGHYNEFDGDEDARACFLCPFCYVEIEIHSLCNHLQEEHCFVLKNAVCPLCAANLGKDVIGHFMIQHASSLKRRRKSQKSGNRPGSPSKLGRELSSFMGFPTGGRGNAHESAPNPTLSPFLCNAPVSDTKDVQQNKCSDDGATVASNLKRIEPHLPDEDHEQNTEERRLRAAFAQQLVMSTFF
ncbi:hypothetical protein PTKIN_Ptkin04bG0002700 [Pterospermum kingtungense]